MSEEEGRKTVVILIPEPFRTAWNLLGQLCHAVRLCEPRLAGCPRWPVLGLAIRGANTTLSIAALAALEQWPDALILGRSLFETEMMVKWLLESDTDQRILEYLSEVEDEKGRFQRKVAAGRSVAAQVMRELLPREMFDLPGAKRQSKPSRKKSVRDRAMIVNLDRSYDIPYWLMSIFAHSHALSLSSWNPELIRSESPMTSLFDSKGDGLAAWMVLAGVPMSALDLIQVTDQHMELGLSERVEATREAFREAITRYMDGAIRFSTEVQRGEVRMESSDGTVKSYHPARTGRDLIDELS